VELLVASAVWEEAQEVMEATRLSEAPESDRLRVHPYVLHAASLAPPPGDPPLAAFLQGCWVTVICVVGSP
jgi:hypothetical protein